MLWKPGRLMNCMRRPVVSVILRLYPEWSLLKYKRSNYVKIKQEMFPICSVQLLQVFASSCYSLSVFILATFLFSQQKKNLVNSRARGSSVIYQLQCIWLWFLKKSEKMLLQMLRLKSKSSSFGGMKSYDKIQPHIMNMHDHKCALKRKCIGTQFGSPKALIDILVIVIKDILIETR